MNNHQDEHDVEMEEEKGRAWHEQEEMMAPSTNSKFLPPTTSLTALSSLGGAPSNPKLHSNGSVQLQVRQTCRVLSMFCPIS